MGNENDKTTLVNELTLAIKGIDDLKEATKEVKELGTAFKSVAEQQNTVAKLLDEISKKTNIHPNQSQYKVGKNNFILTDSKEDRETKSKLNNHLERANEAELTALEAHTESLNAQTQKVKEQTRLLDSKAKTKEKNAQTNAETLAVRKEKLELNRNYYRYRSEHPDEFGTRTKSRNYQMGSALSEIGQRVSGYGLAGRLSGDSLSIIGSTLKNGPWGLAAAGLSKLVSGIADLGKSSLQAYSEIETLKTGLSIISPTQVQADSLFRDVAGYATRSPYGVAQSTELVTLLKQSGVNDSELMSTLTMLGDTAGGNMEKLKRIANNYAQIVSIGKASMLDMRQFAYAGIPIFEAVSKELGVTQQALREMISDGKVTSVVIEKVFKDLTSGNGIFANATEIGAKTFAARRQNLADTKQLALSSIGENIVNLGIGGGQNLENEGFGRILLSMSERFYAALNKWSDNISLKQSLDNISKKNDRVEQLQALIAWHEANGNKNVASELKKELAQVLAFSSFDEDMSDLSRSYDEKTSSYEGVKDSVSYKEIDKMKKSDIKRRIKEADANLSAASSLPIDYYKTMNDDTLKRWQLANGAEFASLLAKNTPPEELISLYQNEVNFWEQVLRAKKGLDKLTDEEKSAHYGTSALKIQQGVSDTSSENSSSNPDSIYNIASQITQLYKNSEEYEKKQLEEQKELWSQVQKTLLDIRKIQNEQGIIDYSKSNAKDLLSYFEKGAIIEERKLTVRKTDDLNKMASDRIILTKQYQTMIELVKDYMSQNGVYDENVNKALDKFSNAKFQRTPAEFFDNFSKIFSNTIETIDKSTNETNKDILRGVKILLTMATLQYSSDTSSADYDYDKFLKGKGDKDFIPLWKRLLSNATGLSANVISGTNSALVNYRDDLAIRNTTGGVLRAGLQGGLGVDFVQQLLKTSGVALELRGDKGGTYQIDWKETEKAVKEFAMQLSASTKVISAYKSGLEAQLNVYETLLSDALVSSETQDIKGDKKFTTAKELSRLAKDYGDQLVNAFGEKLTTKDGLEVSVKDGEFFDQNGNKIAQENVIVTGNIYEFMRQELPKIRQELAEANIQENKNAMLSDLTKSIYSIKLFDDLLKSGFSKDNMDTLLENRKFVVTDFNAQLDKIKIDENANRKKAGLETINLTNEDIIRLATTPEYNENGNITTESWVAIELFEEAVPKTVDSLNSFLNSGGVRDLLNESKRTNYNQNAQVAANFLNKKTDFFGYTEEEKSLDARTDAGWKGVYQRQIFGPALEKLGLDAGLSPEDIADKGGFDTQFVKAQIAAEAFKKTLEETRDTMSELGKEGLKDAFLIPFEKLGEYAAGNANAVEDMGTAYRQLTGSLLSNVGPLVTTLGLEMAKAGVAEGKSGWWKVALGLALAATGGVMAGYGNAVNNAQDNAEDDNEYERLQSIKDDLSEILEQARRDASYYERNMQHKKALGIRENLSHTSVNDAIIAPNGNVITTHPDDYLIATKTPQNLGRTSVSVTPIINNVVNNNSKVSVKQETRDNGDGSIDLITTIEDIVGGFIASSKSDDVFAIREGRKNGRQAVM